MYDTDTIPLARQIWILLATKDHFTTLNDKWLHHTATNIPNVARIPYQHKFLGMNILISARPAGLVRNAPVSHRV
jgi:hypothetical protein